MFFIVDIMKALACILIANFHSDILFPEKLSLLAFGGDIGNNIFFVISGFAIFPSVERSEWKDIGRWYLKRLKRLVPMLLFFYILSIAFGDVCPGNIIEIIRYFVFPTIYWFTGALLIFYPVFFCIEKNRYSYIRAGCAVILILGHLFWDNIYSERYFIGFLAMLTGAYIRRKLPDILNRASNKQAQIVSITFLFGMMYVALKLLRGKGIEVGGVIHLGIGILTIMTAAGALILGCLYESNLKDQLERHRCIHYIIKNLSEVTLAVYLLMGFHDRIIMKWLGGVFIFPMSYIVDLIVSFLLAYIITIIDKRLHSAMR